MSNGAPSIAAPPGPLPWPVRQWLAMFALFGAAIYIASFVLTASLADLAPAIRTGLIATTVAGVTLIVTALRRDPLRLGLWSWLDAGLLTARQGLRVLMIGVLVNLGRLRGIPFLVERATAVHVGILFVAHFAMMVVFVRRAAARGWRRQNAVLLWLVAFDLPLVAVGLLLWLTR